MEKIGIEQFRHQEKMISPEAYLQLLFDHCEDGKLLLARDGRYSRQFEGEKPVSVFKEPQYLCTMVWDEAGFAKLLEEFSELKSKLECLAPYYWDMKPGENEVAKTVRDPELMEVWRTYLKPFVIGGYRKERKAFAHELMEIDGYQRDNCDDEIWPRVKNPVYQRCEYGMRCSGNVNAFYDDLMDRYCRAVAADVRHRVGDSPFSHDLIVSARSYWSMYYYLLQDWALKPQKFTEEKVLEYACRLAEDLALHRFCTEMNLNSILETSTE